MFPTLIQSPSAGAGVQAKRKKTAPKARESRFKAPPTRGPDVFDAHGKVLVSRDAAIQKKHDNVKRRKLARQAKQPHAGRPGHPLAAHEDDDDEDDDEDDDDEHDEHDEHDEDDEERDELSSSGGEGGATSLHRTRTRTTKASSHRRSSRKLPP